MSGARDLVIALAGNPNAGKTSLFNALSGSHQHVGNYPGKTVERKEGVVVHKGRRIRLVDLPGTYSLSARSAEELVARDCLLLERPDAVIDVLDSSNLERNLYLAVQLLEIGVPMVLALNMSDLARDKGVDIDTARLSGLLRLEAVRTVASRGEGLAELLDAAVAAADAGPREEGGRRFDYGPEIGGALDAVEAALPSPAEPWPGRRWTALRLLEDDPDVTAAHAGAEAGRLAGAARTRLRGLLGDEAGILLADRRYGFISGACQEAVRSTAELRHEFSDRMDAVLLNRALGIPIFLGLMYLVFQLTFTLGEAPMAWLEAFFGWLGARAGNLWPEGSDSLLRSFVVDGVIGGVGGVVVFLPNVMLLFLAIGALEDSGYMARAAFLMDRVMHLIGLHGKSFVSMMIGFGCSVPAIMATRTLEHRRDRLATMLVIPLFSCGARLPIYALLIPAFFPARLHATALFAVYLTGIALAVLCALLLRKTLFRGEDAPFIMELPPYRLPTLRSVLLHMWQRGWLYLKKAGTIILAISVLLWVLVTFPRPEHPPADAAARTEALARSFAGRIGRAMEPVLAPMGMDWRMGTALVGAFAAKEVFVAQLAVVYAVEEEGGEDALRRDLRKDYSPLQGLCVMLFCLVGTPCMATVAVIRRESGSWGWAAFQFTALTILAWLLATAVFQAGRLAGLG